MRLHESFTDTSRAASYVAAGIRSDFPDAEVEVVFERRGYPLRHVCRLRELSRVLAECCSRFPMATVSYDKDEPTGLVSEIHCHCQREKSHGCCRYNGHARNRVLVRIAGVNPAQAAEAAPQVAHL